MSKARDILRWLYGVLFALAGANHFARTGFYVSIMPAYLPWQMQLVYASGVAEVALGILLFIRRTSRLAAWGMVAEIIAVTPANVQMAVYPELYPDFSPLLLWLRLPLQFVLIAWAYWYTRPHPADR
jgi:uncharacterized membrane protein